MGLRIVKAMQFQLSGGGQHPMAYVMRFMYEFWGYVIHAPTTTTVPGGFPGTFNTFNANALEGSLVLQTGTDGATTVDQNTFDSAGANFLTAHIGKYIVMWNSSSPGPEDGIYKITGRNSANQITLNINNGGVPHPSTFRPRFTTRSGLRWRLVDIDQLGTVAFSAGQYIVFQMTPSISNTGQANSQVQMILRTGQTGLQTAGLVGSPAGTWTGSAFTDAMTEVTHTSNSQGMFTNSTNTSTQCQLSLFGDKDGLVAWFKNNGSNGSYLHFEAPVRLALQAQDPNPLLCGAEGLQQLFSTSFGTSYNNFWMAGTDTVARRHRMLVKCLSGDGNGENGRPTATLTAFGDSRITVSPTLNKTFLSKILLGQIGTPSTQFNLARATMRYARICPNTLSPWVRVGDAGEFLHIQNGICFPWDNSVLGTNLIPFGY